MNEPAEQAIEANVYGFQRWLAASSFLLSTVFFFLAHHDWRQDWPMLLRYLLAMTASAALVTYLGVRRWRLSLRSGVIRGPGRWSLLRAAIPLADLDRVRSAPRRNPGAVHTLWSTDGTAISIHPHAYRPAELAAFLAPLELG